MDALTPEALALMRARARHRLIGAILLVVLLVIGVPFLLDQSVLDVPTPPPAAAPGAALPSLRLADGASGTGATAVLPGAPQRAPMAGTPTVATVTAASAASAGTASSTPAPAAGSGAADRPSAIPAEAPAVVPPLAEVPAPAAGKPTGRPVLLLDGHERDARNGAIPATPDAKTPVKAEVKADAKTMPKANAQAEAKSEAKSQAKSEAKSEAKSAAQPEAKSEAKSEARPEGKAVAKPEPASDERLIAKTVARGWFVQYGVFFEAPRAQALAARLSEHGILISSEHLHGPRGEFTRLRSGPFNNRPAADTVLARAHALGENAILVHQ